MGSKKKAICTKQVELAQSHLAMVDTDLDAMQERHESVIQRITNLEETLCLAWEEKYQHKRDVEAKSLELITTEDEVDVKSKVLANVEATPGLSPDDVMEFKRHEQVILETQFSLNPDSWTGNTQFLLHFFSCFVAR